MAVIEEELDGLKVPTPLISGKEESSDAQP